VPVEISTGSPVNLKKKKQFFSISPRRAKERIWIGVIWLGLGAKYGLS
jgi:hypothetical protein